MDMQLTREKQLEFASLADPRFTLSRFYRNPIYLGWVAMLDYYVVDDDGVFQSAAAATIVIKESELEQLKSIEQLNALVRECVVEANASLVALVDVPHTLESNPMTNIPDLIQRLQRAVSTNRLAAYRPDGTSLGCFAASVYEASDLMEAAAEELAVLLSKTQPCKTCQWWNAGCGTLATGWKYCDRGGSDDGEPEEGDTLAWAADIKSYGASLLTHETFSCCMHQPREATDGT